MAIDVRIIAAAQGDLEARVRSGEFREDLRQRLDLFRVRVPPLRERGSDVVPLAQALAGQIAKRYGLPEIMIPVVGQTRLQGYGWPGNVRELAHEIERSLVFEDDRLAFSGLVAGRGESGGGGAASSWLQAGFQFPEEGGFDLETAIDQLVKKALKQADENVSAAARLLGVPRDFVRYRLKRRQEEETS